jgi:hypothetical protein
VNPSSEFELRSRPLPAVVTKAYDLLPWLIYHVGKFPCSHRYVLGERIETTMLEVIMCLVEASYRHDKLALLQRANLELEKLRILIRRPD